MLRKTGIFSWYGFRTPIKQRLENIKDVGFDATMLWWGDDKAFDELDKTNLVKETRKRNLEIENIHVPFDNANAIWSIDSAERQRQVEIYKKFIRDCATYQIPAMVMHISKGTEIKEPNNLGEKAIEELAEMAERCQVRLALENTRNNKLLEYLMVNIGSKNLGVCYDTSHAQLYGDETFQLMEKFKDRIFCFHISDNDGQDDKHRIMREGVIDWKKFQSKFPVEYTGIVSAEVYPESDEINEIKFLKSAYTELTDIIRGLN